jgi:hypothetical protein
MKGYGPRTLFMAKSGWYHGASQASVPGRGDGGFFYLRLLRMISRSVLGRVPPRDVPVGYVAVIPLPAALLEDILSSLTRLGEVKS